MSISPAQRFTTALFAMLLALVFVWGCPAGGDDDDDNDDAAVDCNPQACLSISGSEDCSGIENPVTAMACEYCLSDSIRDWQIAQCILDNRGKASGENLRDGCINRVDALCTIATEGDDTF